MKLALRSWRKPLNNGAVQTKVAAGVVQVKDGWLVKHCRHTWLVPWPGHSHTLKGHCVEGAGPLQSLIWCQYLPQSHCQVLNKREHVCEKKFPFLASYLFKHALLFGSYPKQCTQHKEYLLYQYFNSNFGPVKERDWNWGGGRGVHFQIIYS